MLVRNKRRKRGLCWSLFLAALVAAISRGDSSSISSASATATGRFSLSPLVMVDLSYQPHLPGAVIQQALQDHVTDKNFEDDAFIALNLSHLSLGDDGIKKVLGDSDVIRQIKVGRVAHVDLAMNRLTPVGVAWLLHQLLDATTTDSITTTRVPAFQSVNLSWNYLASDLAATTSLYTSVEQLVTSHLACPQTLRFDQCSVGPAFCRALGKGLMQRFAPNNDKEKQDSLPPSSSTTTTVPSLPSPPLSLSLSGNPDIGNAGTAALAAALRTIATTANEFELQQQSQQQQQQQVLQRLDLSACNVGNAGAEALAVALEEDACGGPLELDLSNNQLDDVGIAALGRAMALAQGEGLTHVGVLDISNNHVGAAGCTALLVAITTGKRHLRKLVMRSCHIHADGAEIVGKGLGSFVAAGPEDSTFDLEIDLSGNPLGVLRGKNKKDGSKYSASRIKSTATATAASYMNLLKRGLKDVGMDTVLGARGASAESDDEEEKLLGGKASSEEDDESSSEFAKKRCGAKSMANAFLKYLENATPTKDSGKTKAIRLGLRHCFFDHEAADALAAMIVEAKDQYGVDIFVDVAMNPVLEDEMVSALHGDDSDDGRLREMAERHLDVLEALKEAQERATEARSMARARARSRAECDDDDEEDFDMHGAIPEFDDGVEDSDFAYDSGDDSY